MDALRSGSYLLEISGNGYKDYENTFAITSGIVTDVEVWMEKE